MFKTIPSFPDYMINIDGIIINKNEKVLSNYADSYSYIDQSTVSNIKTGKLWSHLK